MLQSQSYNLVIAYFTQEGLYQADGELIKMTVEKVEEILINAIHSDEESNKYLEENYSNADFFESVLSIVENSEKGDARMKGAYWISKCDTNLIQKNENRLVKLMDDELDSIVVHIMIALSRIKSSVALEVIINKRIKPSMYWEATALENYFGELIDK